MTTNDTATNLVTTPLGSRGRSVVVVATIAAGAVVAVAANSVVAISAIAAGANPAFAPLEVFVYGPLTVLGLVAAFIGWRIIRRRVGSPAAVLRVLVPVLTVLSFVPDTVLAVTGFIPGASFTGVIGLAMMHLVVVGVIVPVSARIAPVR